MAEAWLVVRAVIPDPDDRAAFDKWYHNEHLSDAIRAFSARSAWRGWSKTDPSIHCAYYWFESVERLDAIMSGAGLNALVAEFDRCWSGRVTRSREVLVVADEMGDQKHG